MTNKSSISLLFFCFAFGLLIGVAGLINFAYLSGFVEEKPDSMLERGQSFPSARQRLENYNCRTGETKRIVFRGIEDDFSPQGIEEVYLNPDQDRKLFEASDNLTARGYDESGQDKIFLDQIELPNRTYHGIVSIGLKELSSVRNDAVSFIFRKQDSIEGGLADVKHTASVANMTAAGWNADHNYYWADFSDLVTQTYGDKGEHVVGQVPNFLSAIRARKMDQIFTVRVGDDTMVDFIGFALCLEPLVNKGVVFSNNHVTENPIFQNLPKGQIFLTTAVVNGKQCYNQGCMQCDEKRPLVCIQDVNLPFPDGLHSELLASWSGGNLAFSKAIPASMFETEDDVDDYCQDLFGADWRHLNIKDGSWSGRIVGYGELPSEYSEYWVGVKNSPHHVCWDLRLDYKNVVATLGTSDD